MKILKTPEFKSPSKSIDYYPNKVCWSEICLLNNLDFEMLCIEMFIIMPFEIGFELYH